MRVQTFALASWLIATAIAGSYAIEHYVSNPYPMMTSQQSHPHDIAHRGSGRIVTDAAALAVNL